MKTAATPRKRKPAFDTYFYVLSWGREPKGRGSWAFCERGAYSSKDPAAHTFWSHGTTYGEAKKSACEHFTNGEHVVVCP